MGKIQEINGYIRVTLNKLPGIRADLVLPDDKLLARVGISSRVRVTSEML